MAWVLFIFFLFFAWRAAAYFGQGRPQPGILALGACAVFLAGIFTNYMMFQRESTAEAAPAAPPALTEAAAPPPAQTPPAHEAAPDLDTFYGETDVAAEEAPADDEMAVE